MKPQRSHQPQLHITSNLGSLSNSPSPSFNFPEEISAVLNYRTSYAIPRPASHSHHSRFLVTLRNLRFHPQLRGALSSKRKQSSRDRVR